MVEDETEVVAGAAQQGVDGVANRASKEVTIEPAVVLHVADHGFDGAAPSELTSHRWRQATALASVGRGNLEVIRLLIDAIQNWRTDAAWGAASTLHAIGPSAREHEKTLPALLQLAESPEGQRRARCTLHPFRVPQHPVTGFPEPAVSHTRAGLSSLDPWPGGCTHGFVGCLASY